MVSISAAVWGVMVRPGDGQVSEAKGIPTAQASSSGLSISVYTGASVRPRLPLAQRRLDGHLVERPMSLKTRAPLCPFAASWSCLRLDLISGYSDGTELIHWGFPWEGKVAWSYSSSLSQRNICSPGSAVLPRLPYSAQFLPIYITQISGNSASHGHWHCLTTGPLQQQQQQVSRLGHPNLQMEQQPTNGHNICQFCGRGSSAWLRRRAAQLVARSSHFSLLSWVTRRRGGGRHQSLHETCISASRLTGKKRGHHARIKDDACFPMHTARLT